MSDPILYLVDDRPRVLEALAADLGRRFGADHRILAATDPGKALDELEQLAGRREEVALVVAGQKMAQVPGSCCCAGRMSCTPRPSGCCWSGGGSGHPPTRPCGP
jgi:thioredoxin reductase (NADPH)